VLAGGACRVFNSQNKLEVLEFSFCPWLRSV
jgi:hypothetical protein